MEAYIHLKQILEQVNAIMGSMFARQRIIEDELRRDREQKSSSEPAESVMDDWHLEDKDDSGMQMHTLLTSQIS